MKTATRIGIVGLGALALLSAVHWARAQQFKVDKLFYSPKLKGYVVPEGEVCDLDSLEDFESLKVKFLAVNK